MKKKRQQIRRKKRAEEIQTIIEDKRIQVIKKDVMERLQKIKKQERDDFERALKNIIDRVFPRQSIQILWTIVVLAPQNIHFLSKKDISFLCELFVKFEDSDPDSSIMICWIVGNWCSKYEDLPAEMFEMAKKEINTLDDEASDVNLNVAILQHLTNIGNNKTIVDLFHEKEIITKVIDCNVFENRQQNKLILLMTYFTSLPPNKTISVRQLERLIQYLKAIDQTIKQQNKLSLLASALQHWNMLNEKGNQEQVALLNNCSQQIWAICQPYTQRNTSQYFKRHLFTFLIKFSNINKTQSVKTQFQLMKNKRMSSSFLELEKMVKDMEI